MEWVKLIAVPAYYFDPALLRAGEAAEVLFCRGLAYCGSVESAGVIDKTVLPMLVPTKPQARAAALVREGLWLDEGHQYRIRTWDKWQDEHDVAAEKRRKDRERQREHRRKAREDESRDAVAEVSRDMSRDSHAPNRDGHDVDVEGDVEGEKTPSVSRPRKRGTATPDVFPITPEMAAWGQENAPHVADPHAETRRFLDWTRANGKTYKDWTAAWRNWMSKADGFATERPARRLPNPNIPDTDEWRLGG